MIKEKIIEFRDGSSQVSVDEVSKVLIPICIQCVQIQIIVFDESM